MLLGVDYDADMSAPDGQVARLWIGDLPEFVDPNVQIGRTRVLVGEAGLLVEVMHKVRTIVARHDAMTGIERRAEDRQSIAQGQRADLRGRRLPNT
jgi:hypothetical protein